MEGFRRVANPDTAGAVGLVDQRTFSNPQRVRPLVRGVRMDFEVTPAVLLERDTILRWARQDSEGFLSATRRDDDIRSALATLDYLSQGSSATDSPEVRSLAIAEKLAELSKLAEPYIPRNKLRELGASGEIHDFSHYDSNGKNSSGKKAEGLLDRMSNWIKNLREKRHSRKPQEKSVKSKSPLLTDEYTSGRERQKSSEVTNPDEVLTVLDTTHSYDSKFVITRIYNRLDPSSGRLSAESEAGDLELLDDDRSVVNYETRIRIGEINPQKDFRLGLPRIFSSSTSLRFERAHNLFWQGFYQISIMTENNEEILGQELRAYLRMDDLGNSYIDIGSMPEELKQRMAGQSLILGVSQADNFEERRKYNPELITGLPREEQFRLNLYPPVIQKFVEVLLKKKEEGVRGFRTNSEIFARLAQFLGSYYLQYDKLDAGRRNDEPLGFQQTERVLSSRRASCEGANMALGQLMRHFLEEGEGIAFVDGFQLGQGEQSASNDNLHLKVLYRDSIGAVYLMDATPWEESSYEIFKDERSARKNAVKKWREISADFRNKKAKERAGDEHRRALEISDRLQRFWDTTRSTRDRFTREQYERFLMAGGGYSMLGTFAGAERFIQDTTVLFDGAETSPDGVRSKEVDYRGLMPWLKVLKPINSKAAAFWPDPAFPVEGHTDLKLVRFVKPFYGGNYEIDPYTYTHGGEGRRALLSNEAYQEDVFISMVDIMAIARNTAPQNLESFEQLLENLEALSSDYQERFKQALGAVADKMGTDVDTFFAGAPFMLLLPNPITELDGFFRRTGHGRLTTQMLFDIPTALTLQLREWKDKIDARLKEIEKNLEDAPLTKGKQAVVVSSTFLWQGEERVSKPAESEKLYLDPIETFLHLVKKDKTNREKVQKVNADIVRLRLMHK